VARGEKTFLVESYVPHLDEPTAGAISSRYRAAVVRLGEEGVALRWVQSFALFEEETYLCIVGASDLDHVLRLNERSGITVDHVVEIVAVRESGPSTSFGDVP
jgi:hypothetical protein